MQSLRLYLFLPFFGKEIAYVEVTGAQMRNLNVVYRPPTSKPLSRELTELLLERVLYGRSVVVTNKPHVLHSAVKKRWLYTLRRLKVEQARTLSGSLRCSVTSQILLAQNTRFSSQLPSDDRLDAKITFMSADDCARIAPACNTLCVTYDFPREKLYLMTSWMPKGSLVVIYGS